MNTLERQLTEIMQRAVDEGEVAGANVLVRQRGTQVAYAQAGYADIAENKPLARDSIFRLYSQSKPVTSAAVMLLMDRGLIDLADPVEKYLPGFHDQKVRIGNQLVPAERPVMLFDLLCMTAGLSYPGEDEETAAVFAGNEEQIRAGGGMGTVEFCNRLGQLPLAFQPGSQFRYSTCADVLGAVVEVASGVPFSRFLREEIFDPLGMDDTGFYVPEEKTGRLVTCYDRGANGLAPYSGIHLAVGDYSREPAFASGGAGLVSTLDDYAAFAAMLLQGGVYSGRRILSRQAVERMTSPQLSRDIQETLWWGHWGYSYGHLMRICIEPGRSMTYSRKGEYGWDGWLGTYFVNIPDLEATFLLGQNLTNAGTTAMTRKCRNAVLAAIGE